eukprot:3569293-Prymnesium_polylepis.1
MPTLPSIDTDWRFLGPYAYVSGEVGADPAHAAGGIIKAAQRNVRLTRARADVNADGSMATVQVRGAQHQAFQGWLTGKLNAPAGASCFAISLSGQLVSA